MKVAGKFVAKNSTLILTGVGVVGVVATAILSYKATERTIEEILELRKEAEETYADSDVDEIKIEKSEIIKASWKHWIPVAATVGVTIASIIAAHRINVGKLAALASAYKFSEDTRKNYKQAVLDKFGPNKEKDVEDQAHINGGLNALVKGSIPIEGIQQIGGGDLPIYIDFIGGWCLSSTTAIEERLFRYSEDLKSQGFGEASLSDVLYAIGLKNVPSWTNRATWAIDGEKRNTYEITPKWAHKTLEDHSTFTSLELIPGENLPVFNVA